MITDDILWQQECERLGYKRTGSRSRDTQTWRERYISNQCIQCRNKGSILLNVKKHRFIPALCVKCFNDVQTHKTWSDRNKYCLKSLQDSRHPLHNLRMEILEAIPSDKKGKKPNNTDVDFDGAFTCIYHIYHLQ